MQKQRPYVTTYSLTQEAIPLDPAFPVFMFYYSVAREPINILHSHDAIELGLCLKGHGIFILNYEIHTYEAGDVLAIGPEIYHRAKSSAGMDDLWAFMYFRAEDLQTPELPGNIHLTIGKHQEPDIYRLMRMCIDEIDGCESGYQQVVRSLISALSGRILRIHGSKTFEDHGREGNLNPGIDHRITKAIDMLITDQSGDLSIRDLAAGCCLSESHFRHLFREQVGSSPKHFQVKLKINMAMNLLRDNRLRVVDIAYECGFQSLSSFQRQFKTETGTSPLQWRARIKGSDQQ
jgi:AraC-like DNA-binding protein/quercetin dioxygenase-like cupin family protein